MPAQPPPAGPTDGLRPVPGVTGLWRAAPGWEDVLLGPAGPPLERWREEGRLEAVKRSRYRTVWRLRLEPGPDGNDRIAFLKIAAGGRGGGVRALLDPGRPLREAQAAARVAAAGVATAAPLLAGRFAWNAEPLEFDGFDAGPRGGRGPARALITASVEPAVPLPAALAAADRLAPEVRRRVTFAVAEAVAKLHAAGLFPGDLHPGNLFLRGLEPTADGGFALAADEPEPTLIDLSPLHVRRRWPGRRGRIAASLGMLAHGVAGESAPADRLRFLAAHRAALGAATGLDPAALLGDWREWATRVESVREAESRQRHARRDRHWRRGCRGMRMLDAETRCVAELTDEEAARLLAATEDRSATQAPPRIGDRAVRLVRRSPEAVRFGWEVGHALRRRGVPIAEPLVCRQERHAGTLALAAGRPLEATPEQRRAAGRLCERLRACGYTLDGPRAEDFQLDEDGAVMLANPVDLRPAGRDEAAPVPAFDPPAAPALLWQRAA
ncbi:lipopolysaccharide kinase InaA family protein [Alienimonas californiensis]|uniref:Lipopolysaccharide kinase (Kdo/WaaP) family protein n=1 Tax=Alienimonas californiensis TaxID=2527989 RepID=A0A517P4Z2_9PLAN|nr:lipopolysaccharide kinase InaA family protein [Alienimonas californiensis]QDT14453.1 Lipopolysaccharide kinase (Kdo/WaaP) family protein [Alienimonas californiensis]